ncbi:SAF domain-containing protein [soil metagenome]
MTLIKKRLSRIGIVGTGFIARGLSYLLHNSKNYHLAGMLTRRLHQINDLPIPDDKVYRDYEQLFEKSDLIVVTTGDPIYSTEMIYRAFEYGLPVVTMDAETQIISGSWLSKQGFITEAEGDQPGSLAALDKEIRDMGFEPLVYGNVKSFLNHNPTLEDMQYWAAKNGTSLNQVTSFTDGTKVQIEQCLVANGLGADIYQQGLLGYQSSDINTGALALADKAQELGCKISDYILDRTAPPGVFAVATHNTAQLPYLKYLKMGSKGKFVLIKPYHLCHLEIPKTIGQVFESNKVLLNNSVTPKISVGTIAKKEIKAGTLLSKGIGSFEVRGEALRIAENTDHVPIGLIVNAVLKNSVEPGQLITFSDIDIPDSLAFKAWKETLELLVPAEMN